MIADVIADRYSQALLEIAVEKNLVDKYYEDLRYIEEQLQRFKRLLQVLLAADIAPATKKNIISRIFKDRISPDVLTFLFLLIDKEREYYIEYILECYRDKVNEIRGIIDVEIVLATFPSRRLTNKIKEKISEITGRKVEVTIRRDPTIIGGFQLIIKDSILDFSIQGQLNRMAKESKKPILHDGGINAHWTR